MKTSLKLAALLAITLPAAHAQDFDNYRAEPNQWLGLKDKKFHLNSTNDQGNVCDIEGDLKNNRWEDGERLHHRLLVFRKRQYQSERAG